MCDGCGSGRTSAEKLKILVITMNFHGRHLLFIPNYLTFVVLEVLSDGLFHYIAAFPFMEGISTVEKQVKGERERGWISCCKYCLWYVHMWR